VPIGLTKGCLPRAAAAILTILLARDQRDRAVMLKWTYAFDF
jgi:hypothetical protein